MIIRRETEADIEAIAAVTRAAFADHLYSQQTEPFIINALRAANALTLSLVAEIDGRVVGHVAFSPVTINGRPSAWYGLGPVSVLPECQRQGIGQALIREGLQQLKSSGAQGCVLVGDPDYYVRFGFRNIPQLTLPGVPPQNFLALPFGEHIPHGEVVFHEGFNAKA
jgi:putative acetyltransferase